MDQIMKWIGKALIAAISVFLLIVILMNIPVPNATSPGQKGVFALLDSISLHGKDYSGNSDVDKVQEIVAGDVPTIEYDISGLDMIYEDQDINILDYFKVGFYGEADKKVASDLTLKNFKVLEIENENSEDMLNSYNQDTHIIKFPAPGVYRFTFEITDDQGRTSKVQIKIPVMEYI